VGAGVSLEARLAALRPVRASIDLSQLVANYHAVAAFVPRLVMPVVKADAYGHGAVWVARALEAAGAPLLAVAYAEEGLALRRAGVMVPIVVLAGFSRPQVAPLLEAGLVPVVSSRAMLDALIGVAEHRRLEARLNLWPPFEPVVHVKIDTGMTRLGFAPAEIEDVLVELLGAGCHVDGVMTHLACADEDRAFTERQLDAFDAAVDGLARHGVTPRHVHVANSAGLSFVRESHTLVRPGLLLYGVRPRPLAPQVRVRPVMSVTAPIARIREVPEGTAVSYGARFVARRPTRVATLPIGYADGVPRTDAMREGGSFVLRGRRVPIVGSVCMDLTMADVSDLPEAREGDEAVVMGDEPDAWEIAERAGTNAWQALTAIGARVPRAYYERGRLVGVESRFEP
jgi:alanine racemase